MQYIVPKSSVLAQAVTHALVDIMKVPSSNVVEGAAFGVTCDGQAYNGLMVVLRALRQAASSPEQKDFVGAAPNEQPFVNQWVSVAAMLHADEERFAAGQGAASVASGVFVDVEKALSAVPDAAQTFLCGTPRATIADLLVYAALHGHHEHAGILPLTMQWSAHAHSDAYLAPVQSAAVEEAAAAHGKAGKAGKGGAAPQPGAYVKPSEEEIIRRRAEKEKAKAAKAAAAAAAGGAPAAASSFAAAPKKAAKEELTSTALDIRVGQLSNLRRHPEADRLYVEDMNLGAETRTIVSGLVEHYKEEELNDTYCLVVCNMKPKPLKGVTSHGMVLCASNESGLTLVRPPAGAKPGDRILFGAAYDGAVAAVTPEILSSNKMGDVLAQLHTDGEGVLCWKEDPAHHATLGIIQTPEFKNCVVK